MKSISLETTTKIYNRNWTGNGNYKGSDLHYLIDQQKQLVTFYFASGFKYTMPLEKFLDMSDDALDKILYRYVNFVPVEEFKKHRYYFR